MKIQTFMSFLLILTAQILVGCGGASKTGRAAGQSDQASRNPPQTSGDETSSSGDALLECNFIPENDWGIEGNLTTYSTSSGYIEKYIRLGFSRLPLELTTTKTHYLQIYKWFINGEGKKAYGSNPVDIYFVKKGSSQFLNNSPIHVISKPKLKEIIADNNLGASGVTLDNFFDRYIMILDEMDLTYEGVHFALYDSDQGKKTYGGTDTLLPPVAADPNTYASDHTSSYLQELHPFWNYRNSNWTDVQYQQESMKYCMP